MMSENTSILRAENINMSFGMVVAADDVNVVVEPGEFVGIVGANGSGKTTFLNIITGYLTPDSGRILVMNEDATGLASRLVTKLGVARSFQVPQLYTSMTVLEGMLLSLSAAANQSSNFWKPMYRDTWKSEALETLERFGLDDYANRAVSELPQGGRKLLDIALSFALNPKLLLMDEPTSGVSIEDKFQVMDTLVRVLKEGDITTIFVEHDMEVIQRYGERVLVFDTGRVIADGEPEQVFSDPEVKKTLLGQG
ncbi:MAG TPA: ABC transporter ATP-binding protein [Rhodospirillales bacterium]|nr:ABC transporter ATP-binding protein [Rhodospirillales bacterium]HIA80677.1 ABC transporter ATP-binding protein [Rhodospirillales bacterium]HIB21015.1 ABC transporter ATP-binding protein [Rhodospirillales bacterium]